jgi:GDP-4-dehydro-6-deoxy-D-mannose reductase
LKALLTGINGFAGSFLAEHLLASGDEVLGVVRGKPDLPETLAGVELVDWDLRGAVGEESLRVIHRFGPDCVYHLAAISIPADCGDCEPNDLALAVNVEGTRRIVDLCRSLRRRPRLLFVSSSQVYARDPAVPQTVDEDAPLGAVGAYGKTKLAAEAIVGEGASTGVEAVIARAFQHAGPRQSPRMMLSEWARQFAGQQGPVRVQRLHAHLDFSDVRDVVRAYRLLMARGEPGHVYNVGSGHSLESGAVLEELRRIADPARTIVEMCSDASYNPLANTARLRAATGWQPRIDWRQTVADTWSYWQRQARERLATRSIA